MVVAQTSLLVVMEVVQSFPLEGVKEESSQLLLYALLALSLDLSLYPVLWLQQETADVQLVVQEQNQFLEEGPALEKFQ